MCVQISAERIFKRASKCVTTGMFHFSILGGRVDAVSEVVDEVDADSGVFWPHADGGSKEVDLVGDVVMVDGGGEGEEGGGDDGRGHS